jgi:hypothetical protein
MRVPLEFWRGVLALLGLFFAYMLGRTWVNWRAGAVRLARLNAWILRTVLCALAVGWRHPVDASLIGIYVLFAVAFCGGMWQQSHPRQEEDLSRQIFPDDDRSK